jgi:hypothetical protein
MPESMETTSNIHLAIDDDLYGSMELDKYKQSDLCAS